LSLLHNGSTMEQAAASGVTVRFFGPFAGDLVNRHS
jgi:hypothetical protein